MVLGAVDQQRRLAGLGRVAQRVAPERRGRHLGAQQPPQEAPGGAGGARQQAQRPPRRPDRDDAGDRRDRRGREGQVAPWLWPIRVSAPSTPGRRASPGGRGGVGGQGRASSQLSAAPPRLARAALVVAQHGQAARRQLPGPGAIGPVAALAERAVAVLRARNPPTSTAAGWGPGPGGTAIVPARVTSRSPGEGHRAVGHGAPAAAAEEQERAEQGRDHPIEGRPVRRARAQHPVKARISWVGG